MREKKSGQRAAKSTKRKSSVKTRAVANAQPKPVTAPTQIPATIVKPIETPPVRTVGVMIRTKFYGQALQTEQTLRIPMVEKDMIRLDMTIDLRKSEYIEIIPVRRGMADMTGLIEDAEAIANDRI